MQTNHGCSDTFHSRIFQCAFFDRIIPLALLALVGGFAPRAAISQPAIEVPSSALYLVKPESGEVLWKFIEVQSPMRVRAIADDRFLVCDFGKGRVSEINREGRILWEAPGNNASDARRLADGGTLIVNNGNSEIQRLGPDGQLTRAYRQSIDHPAGALVTESDTVIVADAFNRRMVEFDPQGAPIRQNFDVANPLSVEPLGEGAYLIADGNHHKVFRLNAKWELETVAAGLHHPSDARPLPNGNIVVADTGNGRVVEIDPTGNVVKSIRFNQKPRSVAPLSDGTWLVALTYEEERIEADPRSIEELIAAGEAGHLSEIGPAHSFRERHRYAVAMTFLFGVLAIWVGFQLRYGSTAEPSAAGEIPPPAAEPPLPSPLSQAPPRDPQIKPIRLSFSKKQRSVIGILGYLALHAVLLKFYLGPAPADSVRVLCQDSQLTVSFGTQEIGVVRNTRVLNEGHIGFSFWRESANDQVCERILVRDPRTGETFYEADFRRLETLSEWTVDAGNWRVIPGVGVVNDNDRQGTLRYEKETFGDCEVDFRFRNAAELSVWVRSQGPTDFTKITLRPERHMDAWVDLSRQGLRLLNPSPPFARIVPPFGGEVARIFRRLLDSYFFAFALAGLGAAGFLILYPPTALVFRLGSKWKLLRKESRWGGGAAWRRAGEVLAFLAAGGMSVWMFFESKWVAEEVLERMPHLQDDVAYLFQAKIFAGGDLWVPSLPEPYRRFFDHEFIVNNGKWFGLYTPGTPLLLALGVLLGKPWLVNPALAALSVFTLFLCGRNCYGTWQGLLAAFFLCLSPWVPLMSGTMLSHPGSLWFTILLIWGLVSGTRGKCWVSFLLAGVGLSGLLLIRPGSGVAIGIPAVVWAMVHLARNVIRNVGAQYRPLAADRAPGTGPSRPGWKPLLLRSQTFALLLRYCVLGSICLGAIGFLSFYNWNLSGDPFTNTYQAYSPHLRLGFSPDVGIEWGVGHNRNKAISNLSANLNEFYRYLLPSPEGGGSSLETLIRDYFQIWLFAPLFGVLVWVDRRAVSYLLFAMILGEIAFYYCWFHSGISYGPRFYYALIGPVALLSARGAWLCASGLVRLNCFRERLQKQAAVAVVTAVVASFLLIAPAITPSGFRARENLILSFKGYNGMNRRMFETIEASNLDNAIVFIDSAQTWIPYGNVFWAMSPRLDSPILFARDRGLHNVPKPGNTPLDNNLLRAIFPERDFFKLQGNRLAPIE